MRQLPIWRPSFAGLVAATVLASLASPPTAWGATDSSAAPSSNPAGLASSEEVRQLRAEVTDLRRLIAQLQRQIADLQAGRPALSGAPGQQAPPPASKTPEQIELEQQLAAELGAAAPAAPGPSGTAGPSGAPAQTQPPAGAVTQPYQPSTPSTQPWSPVQPITLAAGGKNFLNLSLDGLAVGGASTARDVLQIETGDHDPKQRGFTVQNVETVLEGAVDPYFRGQANIVLNLDEKGSTNVELEEAYLTSTSLPHNLQVKGGTFFTEFGRLNPQHPHTWDFVDQPLVNGRFLGPDGLRGPGLRVSWLLPTPFYSEFFLTVEDSQGETAFSFRNEPGEEFLGRPVQERPLRTAGDLLYVPHYTASFDLTDTQTLLAGVSAAFGPNASGQDTSTRIYAADLFWKWKPPNANAGFPFVKWQTEGMYRSFEAAAASVDIDGDGTTELALPAATLRDWGAYSQLLWGFRRGWVAGLRGDYLRGDESPFDPSPSRSRRWRVSPNLTWYPTEFSKLRLQYNHDHIGGPDNPGSEESLWLQMEFILGAHAAHKF